MGQRTKWAIAWRAGTFHSTGGSFSLLTLMLRYIVTHEAVHLVVPDHSAMFWLTVQGYCPETERAKRWLSAHQSKLVVDIRALD